MTPPVSNSVGQNYYGFLTVMGYLSDLGHEEREVIFHNKL